jgi:hypothetical protein
MIMRFGCESMSLSYTLVEHIRDSIPVPKGNKYFPSLFTVGINISSL